MTTQVITKDIKLEAIQFSDNPVSAADIVDFVGASSLQVWYKPAEHLYGTVKSANLDISSAQYNGIMYEGEWLVKRGGRIVKLTDRDFNTLFMWGD